MFCLDAIPAGCPWWTAAASNLVRARCRRQNNIRITYLNKISVNLITVMHIITFFNPHIHDYITQMLITTAKTRNATTKLNCVSKFILVWLCSLQLQPPDWRDYPDMFQYSLTLYFLTEQINIFIATNMKNKYIRSHLDTLEYKKLRR